ncbi:MAG: hypothetical protein Q8O92_14475 [Candidatus Latescibacter sp.]|nr:hypothetical protein [Candidatus Latescibacter sp.]
MQYSFCIPSLSIAAFLSCGFNRKSSGIRYLDSLHHILKEIRSKEESPIRDASDLFAQVLINRNRCFLAVSDPLNPGYYAEGSFGLPPVFVLLRSREMAVTIREGDALLTTVAGEIPELAKKQGATVVGLPGAASAKNSSPVLLAIVTALAGEIYRRSEGVGRTGNQPPHDAIRFLDTISSRLKNLKKQRENLRQAALLAGEKIQRGGTLWLYDGRGMFAREIEEGSGTPGFAKIITPMGITDGTLREKDALVFASLTSNAPEEIHLIRMARGITNGIVTICPHEESGGYRLYRESPSGLDNMSPEKEGIETFDNGARTFLHTGGVLNLAIFGMLVGEITAFLDSQGKKI